MQNDNSKLKITKTHGKNWQKSNLEIEKDKLYSIDEALDLLKKISYTKFNPTVEVHIKTAPKKKEPIRGMVKLPHSTGRRPKIAIFNEDLLAEIQKGKLNFDILLAKPSDMPKVSKVAKILGPKGLMPNPKSKTLTENPEKEIENIKAGQVEFKGDAQGNIHQAIGKLSFDKKKLAENYSTFFAAVKQFAPVSATLCTSMSPGIKIQFK